MEQADIVVVGAGPGGLAFAHKAASAGLNTLVLEKRQAVGEFVRCGEALGWDNVRKLGVKPSKRYCTQKTVSALVVSPSGKTFSFKPGGEGYIVERIAFDKELASAAASAGARILTRTRVTSLRREGGRVVVSAERLGRKLDFECRLVVAADGIESRTAKFFGVDTHSEPGELASCAQVEVAGVKIKTPSQVEIYVGGLCPGGYIWVFPKGKDRANVGLGLPVSLAAKPPQFYLEEFMKQDKRFANASVVQDSCGLISCGLPIKEFTRDNLMIVGTAARQVSPIDGGGMGYAIRSGGIAADVAITAFKKGDFSQDFLQDYDRRWYALEGKKISVMYKARKAASVLTDGEFDYLVENLDKLDIKSIWSGGGLGKAVAFFMKKPSLVRVARYLV